MGRLEHLLQPFRRAGFQPALVLPCHCESASGGRGNLTVPVPSLPKDEGERYSGTLQQLLQIANRKLQK